MPTISPSEAAERIARVAEQAQPTVLAEIHAELFPDKPSSQPLCAADLAQHIRGGLQPEELVSLWNIIYPRHRNVWYDEDTERIHYNERSLGYAEAES